MLEPLAQPIRPSRTWYAVAAVLLALAVGAGFMSFQSFKALMRGSQRMVVPGSATLQLDEAGTYIVVLETRSVFEGRSFNSSRSGWQGSLAVESSDGTTVAVTPSITDVTYSFPNHAGSSIAQFTVPRPGAYTIDGSDGGSGNQVVLAVMKNPMSRIFGAVAWAMGAMGLGFMTIVLWLVTLIRRSMAKRRALNPPLSATSWQPPPSPSA